MTSVYCFIILTQGAKAQLVNKRKYFPELGNFFIITIVTVNYHESQLIINI